VRLRTAAGMIVAENRHFFCPYKHLRLEAPQLDWRLQALEACAWQVQIKTDRLAKSLALLELPENVAVSENYFDLDGGCEKSITISRPAAAASLETGELVWKWLS